MLCFSEEYDSYIIVSFVNATLVLSIGETVEEITDSGFLGTTPTLSCSLLGEDALLQVLIRHSRYAFTVILHFVMMIKLRTPYDHLHDINRISKSEQNEVYELYLIPAVSALRDIFLQHYAPVI